MRRWWVLALSGLLAGCVRLTVPTPRMHEYQLSYSPPALPGSPLSVLVEVGPIGVAAVYDREPMVYRDDAHATGTYVGSRWSANPGPMVTDLLVRDMSTAGSYRAVQRAPALLAVDYRLSGEIVEFDEQAAAHACSARLSLRLVLARATAGQSVLWQRTYDGQAPCACNQPSRLAAAMSQALAEVSVRLQRDVYETIATDTNAVRPPAFP